MSLEFSDLIALMEIGCEARERFPDAYRTFLAEFEEPVETRREAFRALVGYVNSHLPRRSPGLPEQDIAQRQRYICLGLISFLPPEQMYDELPLRFWKDLIPVDESLPN